MKIKIPVLHVFLSIVFLLQHPHFLSPQVVTDSAASCHDMTAPLVAFRMVPWPKKGVG